MPMNARLLRPLASGVHPEAAAWRSAVVANGGSVSASTLKAVADFCKAIDAAGIRDRFYRLNLFAGTGLNACLVPLYRGQSRTGTQGGRTTDSNHGPFVSGDYSETAGLTGNGSSKHLRIGTLNSVYQGVPATGHMAVWTGASTDANKRTMGIFDLTLQSGQPYTMHYGLGRSANSQQEFGRAALIIRSPSTGSVLQTVTRASSTSVAYYENATSLQTSATESINRDIPDADVSVFGQSFYNWNNNTFSHGYEPPATTYSSYSCGLSLTGAQVTSYYNALAAFRTAMGRT